MKMLELVKPISEQLEPLDTMVDMKMLQKAHWDTVKKRLLRKRKAKVTTQKLCKMDRGNGPKKLFGEKRLRDGEFCG